MNRLRHAILTVAVSCLLLGTFSESHADNFAVDNAHSSVIFGISHFGYSYTYGRFSQIRGNFSWDNANPAASRFVVAIDTASIDTNDAKRDDHLRSADFFNANQFPQIIFQSTSVRPAQQNPNGNMYDVIGNLTMHGVTKQVTLPMKKMGEGNGPYGKFRSGFFCQTTLKRSEYGMTNMVPNIGDQVAEAQQVPALARNQNRLVLALLRKVLLRKALARHLKAQAQRHKVLALQAAAAHVDLPVHTNSRMTQ